ncbi:MAG: nucleotidyltransferase family protein [Clostridiales bacterium]|nr:nucleotidyltransferase family protein [Clostridiales bacterium]
MPVIGITAEYNPYHNGHLYHINASKLAVPDSKMIVIMSGGFTQRGEIAICDKFTRTRIALENGADLVAELPVYYAVSSAEYFAAAAVKLMNASGVITHISFGAESGDLERLRLTAAALNEHNEAVVDRTRKLMAEGMPYFTAREQSLASILRISHDFISQPNQILAIEYLKTLEQTKSALIPVVIKRSGSGYHETASALRALIMARDYPALADRVPENAFFSLLKYLSQYGSADISRLDGALLYLLRTKPPGEIKSILDMNDGVAERMLKLCGLYDSSTGLLGAVKTKRYAYTRLKRAAAHLLLDIRRDTFEMFNQTGGPRYIRVLGFRKDAAGLLGELTRRASLPVIVNLRRDAEVLDEAGIIMLNKDIQSTDMYYLACERQKNTHGRNHEYYRGVIVI